MQRFLLGNVWWESFGGNFLEGSSFSFFSGGSTVSRVSRVVAGMHIIHLGQDYYQVFLSGSRVS